MRTRQLGTTDLYVTPLGLGAWALGGGGWQFGWGPQDDRESIAAVRRAIDLGINWIDTAAVYGLGRSEEVIARALDGVSPRPYVLTKCGLVWGDDRRVSHNIAPASIRREIEDSLRRLRTDAIDLYQMHWPALPPDGPTPLLEDAWRTLADLRAAGKVRWIGASNFTPAHLERVRAIASVASLQPPYSMLRRGIETEILPYCQRNDIGVIVYSTMVSGLLSGSMTRRRIAALPDDDWRKTLNPEFQEPKLTRNLALVEHLRAIGARHGRTPGEIAIAWTLRRPVVTGAIVGARRPEQVEAWIGAVDFRLSEAEVMDIEARLTS